jgi:hypothetical protein
MFSSDDLAADLPPPRDDEPATLRQDIVDELADHLHCALRRELLSGAPRAAGLNPAAHDAWQRVLSRFGHPAQLARRLWWDAMKEKVMAQRATAAAAICAALAACITCFMAWRILSATQDQSALLAERQMAAHTQLLDRIAQLLDDQQQANADLAASLAARTAGGAKGENGLDWHPLTLRMVNDRGEPRQDEVRLSGKTMAGGELHETMQANAEGIADFGSLPAGEYTAYFSLKDLGLSSSMSFLLGPDRPTEHEVTLPSAPPAPFDLRFEIQPPADLEAAPLYYLAHVDYHFYDYRGGHWDTLQEGPVLLLDSRGAVLGQTDYESVTVREDQGLDGAYFINFVERLPADFDFQEADPLPAYYISVQFWPYVAAPDVPAPEEARPELHRLVSAALRELPGGPTEPGQQHTVRVDGSRAGFWHDVRDNLGSFEAYAHFDIEPEDDVSVP